MSSRDTKVCLACGREFAWRRRWERNWEEVRYCSRACRSAKPGPRDREVEAEIIDALRARPGKALLDPDTLCAAEPERARRAARRLAARGAVEFVAEGRVVDASRARGAVRVRLTAEGRRRRES
jgi:hypothetical protein